MNKITLLLIWFLYINLGFSMNDNEKILPFLPKELVFVILKNFDLEKLILLMNKEVYENFIYKIDHEFVNFNDEKLEQIYCKFPNIRYLNIHNFLFTKNTCEIISKFSNVQKLDIGETCSYIIWSGPKNLMYLSYLSELKELSLSGRVIHDDIDWSQFKKLKILDLSFCEFRSKPISKESLSECRSLKFLDIRYIIPPLSFDLEFLLDVEVYAQ